jgi:hypothetical protein
MKTLRIPEPTTWRPDRSTLYHFGDYRIPLDMSEELALRAVAEGVGTLIEAKVILQSPETKVARKTIKG